MGQAAVPMMIISSMMQVASSVSASKSASAEGRLRQAQMETEAKQEELSVIQREADRKERLSEALASQIASSGSKGIFAFSGSPLTILQEDIRKEKRATERDIFQSRLAAMSKRDQGRAALASAKNRSAQYKQKAVFGLLDNAKTISGLVKPVNTQQKVYSTKKTRPGDRW